ncbi:MAG: hypothetical protein M3O28_12730 [Actinomycetota bacterium]|nr:hypothetical protein [Actinomycetota bacterium]
MPSVALVTCRDLPHGDEDGDDHVRALEKRGVAAAWHIWDDPSADWSADLVVVRSTWDYPGRREQFLSWAASVPRLANPVAVLRWNSDKIYLSELADAGIPVVTTRWFGVADTVVLPTGPEIVVKPSVGAGSRGVGRFLAGDATAALDHATHLQAEGRVVMVQPYLDRVDSVGETALVYIDGEFSHAIRKGAMLAPGVAQRLGPDGPQALYIQEDIRPRSVGEPELAVGRQVMDHVRRHVDPSPLYARVDLLPSTQGPLVVELELTEPSLFLAHAEGAVDTFARAIAGRT